MVQYMPENYTSFALRKNGGSFPVQSDLPHSNTRPDMGFPTKRRRLAGSLMSMRPFRSPTAASVSGVRPIERLAVGHILVDLTGSISRDLSDRPRKKKEARTHPMLIEMEVQ